MAYLTSKKKSPLASLFSNVFPFVKQRDAKHLHAFQCLCSVPEYELIAPISVPREKIISKGQDDDDSKIFQAIYDSRTKSLRILDYNGFMKFYRKCYSNQIFEVTLHFIKQTSKC